jgi:hypothetical protein
MILRIIPAISVLSALFAPRRSPWLAMAEQERLFDELIETMERNVIALARNVEAAYKNRCSTALSGCAKNSYSSCVSSSPNATCYTSQEYGIAACTGSSLFDFTTSSVSLPSEVANGYNGNPLSTQVSNIEYESSTSLCCSMGNRKSVAVTNHSAQMTQH